MSASKPTGDRQQLQDDDFVDPAKLRRALNDMFLLMQQRIGALKLPAGVYLPEPFVIQTNKSSTAYGQPPFPIRVALPDSVTPAAVVIGGIVNQSISGAPATVAHDAKWEVKPGGGGIMIRHIPGLSLDSKYLVRLVVFRA